MLSDIVILRTQNYLFVVCPWQILNSDHVLFWDYSVNEYESRRLWIEDTHRYFALQADSGKILLQFFRVTGDSEACSRDGHMLRLCDSMIFVSSGSSELVWQTSQKIFFSGLVDKRRICFGT